MNASPRITHPAWCSPIHCRVTDVDVHHRSTPVLLTTADQDIHRQLVRADEHAFARPGETELLLDVRSTVTAAPDTQWVLRLEEVELFALGLLTEGHRAVLLDTPTLHERRAA